MTEQGLSWSRTTVAKLESGKRGSLSVSELLGLSLVFDLPPLLLLADPRHGRVDITDAHSIQAWDALFWSVGLRRPRFNDGRLSWGPPGAVSPMFELIEAGLKIEDCMVHLREPAPVAASADDPAQQWHEEQQRRVLKMIRATVNTMSKFDAPLPLTASDVELVRQRGTELGVPVFNEIGD